ncbi:MAG: hypothetical protein RR942_06265 [Romboutsia sp.]
MKSKVRNKSNLRNKLAIITGLEFIILEFIILGLIISYIIKLTAF